MSSWCNQLWTIITLAKRGNCTLYTEKTSTAAIFLFFQFWASTNETKISSGMFKRVVISKIHSSQHLAASFHFCDNDTKDSVTPLTSQTDSSFAQCSSHGAVDVLFVSDTCDSCSGWRWVFFLSHHAITDGRKINASKINMLAVYFSSTFSTVHCTHLSHTVRGQSENYTGIFHDEFICVFVHLRLYRQCTHFQNPARETHLYDVDTVRQTLVTINSMGHHSWNLLQGRRTSGYSWAEDCYQSSGPLWIFNMTLLGG